ncbi:enolase-phosphatase E1 [Lucilia sericata]|uniref:enolase-phosphatase E1 n=1 Tax=Lucilia sericata TaxID=13632 RepID=UPI0018A841D7|nr:enolase-phosphatase E1 [Lucilia sericata]
MCEFSVKIILTDIEGTTTSISFVKDTLFPYAKEHTEKYLQDTCETLETKNIIKDLKNLPQYEVFLKETSTTPEKEVDINVISQFVNYLIDKDLKLGPLKTLQGYVWAEGYKSGNIKGHVYPDVPAAFKLWHEAGVSVAIYSSGSIKAQQLLFGQTELGNLLPYITAHFDTTSGHKQEKQSYINIAQSLNIDPQDILFLTDIVKEAEAARLAGYQTAVLSRPGNGPLTDDDKSQFTILNDFESLKIVPK